MISCLSEWSLPAESLVASESLDTFPFRFLVEGPGSDGLLSRFLELLASCLERSRAERLNGEVGLAL